MEDTAALTAAHHDVQRWLGRCVLLLQAYERRMKALVAHRAIAGPAADLQRMQQVRIEADATCTLGVVTGRFLESLLVNQDGPPTDGLKPSLQRREVGIQMTIGVSGVDYVRVQADLKALVALRNELVHHFFGKFALGTQAGCDAALDHLQCAHAHIQARYQELQIWGDQLHDARMTLAALIESPAFIDCVVNGIAPDGQVHWPAAGIVCALREASTALAVEGWTSLSTAIGWIARHHPEQQPAKYGCRRWPQVLHESRAFDLRYRPQASGPRQAWYRVR